MLPLKLFPTYFKRSGTWVIYLKPFSDEFNIFIHKHFGECVQIWQQLGKLAVSEMLNWRQEDNMQAFLGVLEEAPSNWKLETDQLPLYNDETLFLSAIYFKLGPSLVINVYQNCQISLYLKIQPCRQKILTKDCKIYVCSFSWIQQCHVLFVRHVHLRDNCKWVLSPVILCTILL